MWPFSRTKNQYRARNKRGKKSREFSKLLHMGRRERPFVRRTLTARSSIKVAKFHMHKKISRFITPRFLMICMSVTLAGICVGILFFSSFFTVSDIVIIRDQVFVEPQKIEIAMRPVIGKNMFFVDQDQLRSELEALFPTIARVEVQKMYPQSLQVRVYSWPMVARISYLDRSGTGYLLSENGYVVSDTLTQEEVALEDGPQDGGSETGRRILADIRVPRYVSSDAEQSALLSRMGLEAGRRFLAKETLDQVRFALRLYERNFEVLPEYIALYPFEREVHIVLGGGTTIMLWLDADIETQMFKLKTAEPDLSLGNGSLAYVDLRIRDKIFTCRAGAACSTKLRSSGVVGR